MAPTTARTRSASSWRARRVPIAPRDGACLGVLLASYVSSRQRLGFLRQALNSIASQVVPPDCLVLSWYADEPMASEVQAMLRVVKLPFRFRCLRQSKRHSQYGHLREALAAFELEMPRDDAGAAQTWLLFSDDDDLWHPHRVRLARLACAEASAEPPRGARQRLSEQRPSAAAAAKSSAASSSSSSSSSSSPPSSSSLADTARTNALAFGVYAYPTESVAQAAASASEVDSSLDRRQCGIWLGACEVFQFAVRPWVLRSFLRAEPEAVLRHRFADVRFVTWMRHTHAESLCELGADELMRLDACGTRNGAGAGAGGWNGDARNGSGKRSPPSDARKPKPPSEQSAEAQRWVVRNWLYFYRNQRQLSAVEWLGDLETWHSHVQGVANATASDSGRAGGGGGDRGGDGGGGGQGGEGSYERASTGRQEALEQADRAAARKLLRALGPPAATTRAAAAAASEAEELSVAGEIGRMRHHAELTAMMCMQYRNAAELATIICQQGDGGGAAAAGGTAEAELQAMLKLEQGRLVREALEAFGHRSRCKGLPVGTVEECLR